MVVLHGCGGVSEHHHRWAAELVRWGYVVLVLDSFGPRGYRNICAETGQVSVMARAYDAYVAADHLRGLPHVRADRIGVIGFSHGGMAALRAVQRRTVLSLDWRPFQASVAFYPACEAIDPELVTPLLVLIGDKDDWTPASRCRDVEPILRPREHVSMVFYPNAYHGFDRELPPRSIMGTSKWRHLEYDGIAAKDAAQKTRAWLDRYLK